MIFVHVHLFRHLLHSSLPSVTSQVWIEGKSAKSEIFRQTDFLTDFGEISPHNVERGRNNQMLLKSGQGLGIEEKCCYDTKTIIISSLCVLISKSNSSKKCFQNIKVSINLILLLDSWCWQMSNCIHLERFH